MPSLGPHALRDDDAVVPMTKREKRRAAAAAEAAAIAAAHELTAKGGNNGAAAVLAAAATASSSSSSSSSKATAAVHADSVAAAAAASAVERQWCVIVPWALSCRRRRASLAVSLARAACPARVCVSDGALVGAGARLGSVFVEPADNGGCGDDGCTAPPSFRRFRRFFVCLGSPLSCRYN